jgi:polyhydroxyalkanoate synthase
MELLRQAQFTTLDFMRRAQGHALGAIGFGPVELTHRRLASGAHWRLRDYGGAAPETSLLIIAAPIKRPYIWDLGPTVSAIRYCLSYGARIYLLEWIAPTQIAINGTAVARADRGESINCSLPTSTQQRS